MLPPRKYWGHLLPSIGPTNRPSGVVSMVELVPKYTMSIPRTTVSSGFKAASDAAAMIAPEERILDNA